MTGQESHGDAPASRRRRLALAYGYLAAVGVAAVTALVWDGVGSAVVQALAMAAMVVLWFALRSATRLVMDLPAEALAAVRARFRDRAFVVSYQLLGALTILISATLFTAGRGGLGEPLATALAWLAFGSALGIPVVVAAVAVPDPELS